jgi:hypothetical protein
MTEASRDQDEEAVEPNPRGVPEPAPESVLSDEAVKEAIAWAKGSAVDDLIDRMMSEQSQSRERSDSSS